ncbi:aldo/keto reductase [Clostridium sp.]|uniref:aldo/keto reductase n=1 Tax=Clostridium sp. TaxID=1506 RepID=UPI0025B9C7F1|nr:aldo/keto reductase [Clostridium sp.]MCI9304548.1 aldo/keto reductase [Clostridium sp.]
MNSYKSLLNGIDIPKIGFGTYKLKDENETIDTIKYALKVGYRFIDTASFYGNEEWIGKAIKESKIKRENIFLATKVWNDSHGYDKAIDSFEKSMKKLDIDYLDLLLIHWPTKLNKETWRAFESLYELGKVRAIGVCNFKIGHLEELRKTAKIMPMVNQIEVHPCFSQKEIVNYCNNYKIQVIGWSPIMKGQLLEVPLMIDLAEKYNKTIAQIALRWHIQKGIIPIPKSSHYGRIADNIDIFNFELSEEDMIKIDKLDRNETVSGIPENTTYNDFKW